MVSALLRDAMPRKNRRSGKTGRRSGKTGRRVGKGAAGASGFGTMNPVKQSDLRVRPPSLLNVPSSVPRNIQRQIVWDVVKLQSLIPASTTLVETNYLFTLTQNPQYTSWVSLFDQYSIPQVTIEFDSLTPPGDVGSSPTLYTALDFDNGNTLGSVSAILGYDTAESVVMAPQSRHMRSVRPSSKIAAQQSGGGSSQAVVSGPVWVDSTFASQNFYGIRSILTSLAPSTGVNVVTTIYFCFRGRV